VVIISGSEPPFVEALVYLCRILALWPDIFAPAEKNISKYGNK